MGISVNTYFHCPLCYFYVYLVSGLLGYILGKIALCLCITYIPRACIYIFFLCVYRYVKKISVECWKINSDVGVLPLEAYQ